MLILTLPERAAAVRAWAPDAMVVTDLEALERVESRLDTVMVDGLEALPWDRWVLQRVHRALRLGGTLIVRVPLLTSVATFADAGFFRYAGRQVLRHVLSSWDRGLDLRGPVHRRYYLPWLARKLQSVGYTALTACSYRGRAAVSARKASPLAAIRPAPHPVAVAARRAWMATHPRFADMAAQPLDPAQWRDANVLVLAPHPDDELIGCGGTLCRLVAAGANVTILHATDGAALQSLRDLPEARRRTVRLEEAERVARALGARVAMWREPDGGLRCTAATSARLAQLLDELRPAALFTPFLGDPHADHRTLSAIAAAALRAAAARPEVLQYEVWSLVPANRYCDVTQEAETLARLISMYDRAMRVDDFVHFCAARNLARALETTGRGYAEAFLSTSSEDYCDLAEPMPA